MPRLLLVAAALALLASMANAITMYNVVDKGYLGAVVVDPAPCGTPPYTYSCGSGWTEYYVFFSWGTFRLDMSGAMIMTSQPLGNYLGTGIPLCFAGDIINDVFYARVITDANKWWLCSRLVRYW